jgi:hypothetical protein
MDPTRWRELLERFPIRLDRHGLAPPDTDPRMLAVLNAKRWITALCGPDRLALTQRGREALDRLRGGKRP